MNIKKMLALVLAMLAIFAFAACSNTGNGGDDTTTPPTTTPQETFSRDPEPTTAPTAQKTPYTVTVVDQNNDVVAGVNVQICVGDTCLKPQTTDAEGNAVFQVSNPDDAAITVQINGSNSPEGYTYPTEKAPIADGETTVTVTITKN